MHPAGMLDVRQILALIFSQKMLLQLKSPQHINYNHKNTLSTSLQSFTGQIQLLNRTKLLSPEVFSTPISELLYVKGKATSTLG